MQFPVNVSLPKFCTIVPGTVTVTGTFSGEVNLQLPSHTPLQSTSPSIRLGKSLHNASAHA